MQQVSAFTTTLTEQSISLPIHRSFPGTEAPRTLTSLLSIYASSYMVSPVKASPYGKFRYLPHFRAFKRTWYLTIVF